MKQLRRGAVRAATIGAGGLALFAPDAGARATYDAPPARHALVRHPVPAATPRTVETRSAGFDWTAAAIAGAAFAGVAGAIWLAAAAIARATRRPLNTRS
jgi:hypothetical protein